MTVRSTVLITTSFPIREDGSEAAGAFVSDLVEGLSRHLVVSVVAPGYRNSVDVLPGGTRIYRYQAPSRALSSLNPVRPVDALAIARVMHSGLAATRLAVRASGDVHMLALWTLPSGHWARKVGREQGMPYSVWALGSDIWKLGRSPLFASHVRRVLRDAAARFADGLELASEAQRLCGKPVDFLPTARSLSSHCRVHKDAPPYHLLFLGRWHPNKGVDLLMDALSQFSDDTWQRISRVSIYGGGELQDRVLEGAAKLIGEGRPVEVGGYLDKGESQAAFQRADFVLLPSRIESIPLVYSDAVAMGCPVVAMPVGDLRRLISEQGTGTCAAAVTATAFAAAVAAQLESRPADYGQALKSAARQFDLTGSIVPRLAGELGA